MNEPEKSDELVVPTKSPNETAACCARVLRVPRGAHQHAAAAELPRRGDSLVASRLAAAKPTESHDVGANAPAGRTLDPITPCPSSLSLGSLRRSNPRQEPSAVVPHARICAGGDPNRKVKGRPYRDLPIGGKHTLIAEVGAWEQRRNRDHARIDWLFHRRPCPRKARPCVSNSDRHQTSADQSGCVNLSDQILCGAVLRAIEGSEVSTAPGTLRNSKCA